MVSFITRGTIVVSRPMLIFITIATAVSRPIVILIARDIAVSRPIVIFMTSAIADLCNRHLRDKGHDK